jgi:hypothetical protein
LGKLHGHIKYKPIALRLPYNKVGAKPPEHYKYGEHGQPHHKNAGPFPVTGGGLG